jgi:hypothetical protein
MNFEIALNMMNSVHDLELPIAPAFKHLCDKVELIQDQDDKYEALETLDLLIEEFAYTKATSDENHGETLASLRKVVQDTVTAPVYQPFAGVEVTEANYDEFCANAY